MGRLMPITMLLLLFSFQNGLANQQDRSTKLAQNSSAAKVTGEYSVGGQVLSADGAPIVGASTRLGSLSTITDAQGHFQIYAPGGNYKLEIMAENYARESQSIALSGDLELNFQLQPAIVVTVHPEPEALNPDPSTRILARENVLNANPGRPGVPISIPGLPAETASGGIKAPQYFAPGVAGDHGEPIAQYFQIGNFLLPNNLPANAHGNGYADPNPIISGVIGSVQTDGGAFNVRHGNNAINLSDTFGLRPRLEPYLQLTGDYRDFDLVLGWSPANPAKIGWIAAEISFGNGYLERPEARQQYKINAYRALALGKHNLSFFGLAYYGFSRIPGLIPIEGKPAGETIDANQLDLTDRTLFVGSDSWQLTDKNQLQLSGFVETYSLELNSDFGDGLIKQSEFREVGGGNVTYLAKPSKIFSLLAGIDLRSDAPKPIRLRRADDDGIFQSVTENKFRLTLISPFFAIDGGIGKYIHYDLGLRRDQVRLDNRDILNPTNSFNSDSGLTTPKATLTLLPPESDHLPMLSFSYGQAFHTNDPRIGVGDSKGTIIARSRAYQLVLTEYVKGFELRTTLAHVTNASELAKIDADTGLQEDVGASLVRSVTISIRREFSFASFQASFSRATATDRVTRADIPEAPRLIFDLVGTINRLPLKLHSKVEYENVGRKPLGDGFISTPVRELRGSLFRAFANGRFDAGVNFLITSGFTGQTLETLQLPGESAPMERAVGVPLKSYASFTLTYHFRKAH